LELRKQTREIDKQVDKITLIEARLADKLDEVLDQIEEIIGQK